MQALQHRADGKLYRIQTPQTPIARTKRYNTYKMDEFPSGMNMIVAVLAYTGEHSVLQCPVLCCRSAVVSRVFELNRTMQQDSSGCSNLKAPKSHDFWQVCCKQQVLEHVCKHRSSAALCCAWWARCAATQNCLLHFDEEMLVVVIQSVLMSPGIALSDIQSGFYNAGAFKHRIC